MDVCCFSDLYGTLTWNCGSASRPPLFDDGESCSLQQAVEPRSTALLFDLVLGLV